MAEIVSFSFICKRGESEEKQRNEADDDSGCQPGGKWHHVETLVDAQSDFRIEQTGETKRENREGLDF